jgi:hypothetical protein
MDEMLLTLRHLLVFTLICAYTPERHQTQNIWNVEIYQAVTLSFFHFLKSKYKQVTF